MRLAGARITVAAFLFVTPTAAAADVESFTLGASTCLISPRPSRPARPPPRVRSHRGFPGPCATFTFASNRFSTTT